MVYNLAVAVAHHDANLAEKNAKKFNFRQPFLAESWTSVGNLEGDEIEVWVNIDS